MLALRVRRIVLIELGWWRSLYETRLLRQGMRRFRVVRRMGYTAFSTLQQDTSSEDEDEEGEEEDGLRDPVTVWPHADDGF